MIKANELRMGNLLTWNPKLVSPNNTLPPMPVVVSSILRDRIFYVFPNIENRVEPFEDDVAQAGTRFKLLEELEPLTLTAKIFKNCGFEEKSLFTAKHFKKGILQLRQKKDVFEFYSINYSSFNPPVSVAYFHQLQNLYFALTGEELDITLHGQQT